MLVPVQASPLHARTAAANRFGCHRFKKGFAHPLAALILADKNIFKIESCSSLKSRKAFKKQGIAHNTPLDLEQKRFCFLLIKKIMLKQFRGKNQLVFKFLKMCHLMDQSDDGQNILRLGSSDQRLIFHSSSSKMQPSVKIAAKVFIKKKVDSNQGNDGKARCRGTGPKQAGHPDQIKKRRQKS